ncbi:MAG: LysR family transcriptional regulator, partial [Verrucomicrobiota bacterium]
MQIETLRLFCDLVEAGSFSTAAEKHHVTQSAVSQRIAALEKELETKLLVRGRILEATAEGKLFLQMAHQILNTYDQFRRELREARESVEGVLRLATVYSIGLHELPPYLKWFRAHFPKVEVQVDYYRSSQVYTEVREERADLGLVAYPEEQKGIEKEVFWNDELVVVSTPAHPFAELESLQVEDLEGERFIAFEAGLPTQAAIERLLEEAG